MSSSLVSRPKTHSTRASAPTPLETGAGSLRWDWLLVAAICLAPATSLRVGPKVGPGELLAVLWLFLVFASGRLNEISAADLGFWAALITSFIIGSFIGLSLTPMETNVEDLLIWAFLGIVYVGSANAFRGSGSAYVGRSLRAIAALSAISQLGLFLYSVRVSSNLFGYPLWFGQGARYSGLADNPHQVALLLAASSVILVAQVFDAKANHRLLALFLAAASLYVGYYTYSSTLVASLAVGFSFILLRSVCQRLGGRGQAFALMLFVAAALVAMSRSLAAIGASFVSADDNGEGRFELWSDWSRVANLSPLFGLGPGLHAADGRMEFHNTVIEIFGAGGLVAAIIFVAFHARLLVASLRGPIIGLAVVPLIAYGVAGFSGRRLVYWGIVGLVIALIREVRREDPEIPESSKDSERFRRTAFFLKTSGSSSVSSS